MKKKKLEAQKFWKKIVPSLKKFDAEEQEFFKREMKEAFNAENLKTVEKYCELIEAICAHYQPAVEARRIRLTLELVRSI